MNLFTRAALGAVVPVMLAVAVRGSGAQTAASGPTKVAFIRSREILAAAPGASDAQATFNKELETVQATEKAWSDSLQGLIASYGKEEGSLSQADKDARQKAIRDHQQDWQKRDQDLQQHLQQRQTELIQPIMDQINKVIEEIRTKDGYAIVFDAQAQGSGIVAADKSLDLTDQVISRVKALPAPSVANGGATPPKKPAAGPVQSPAGVTRPKSPGN
jgi:outer membrane protein